MSRVLDVTVATPALVDGHVAHQRIGPIDHGFRHRCHMWLVDLDHIPTYRRPLSAAAGFRATDHLGGDTDDATDDIKTNVERFLALNDVDLGDGSRILMLTQARVLGYVFNPLTVYWCFDDSGAARCVIAEVHNTYGDRHAYLLKLDDTGTAQTGKAFYVSPFNDLSGRYTMSFTLHPDHIGVDIVLNRDGKPAFEASFDGKPQPATPRRLAALTLRRPMMPLRVSALIRFHGIWLWVRRLPVVKRPRHRRQEGV